MIRNLISAGLGQILVGLNILQTTCTLYWIGNCEPIVYIYIPPKQLVREYSVYHNYCACFIWIDTRAVELRSLHFCV